MNIMRLPIKTNPHLCLGLPSREWGAAPELMSCGQQATKLVMRSDHLLGFGTPSDHPFCLDVTEGDSSRLAQGWACWGGNRNQEVEFVDTGDWARLRWKGSNVCLQPVEKESWSGGVVTGGTYAGAKLGWGMCDENNESQRWGWEQLAPE